MPWTPDNAERGQRLKEAREAKGMRAEELVKLANISLSTLSRQENGHAAIPWDTAEIYARELGGEATDYAQVLSPSFAKRIANIETMLVAVVPDLLANTQERDEASAVRETPADAAQRVRRVEELLALLRQRQAEREAI